MHSINSQTLIYGGAAGCMGVWLQSIFDVAKLCQNAVCPWDIWMWNVNFFTKYKLGVNKFESYYNVLVKGKRVFALIRRLKWRELNDRSRA